MRRTSISSGLTRGRTRSIIGGNASERGAACCLTTRGKPPSLATVTQRFTGQHIANLAVGSANISAEVSVTASTSATGNTCMTIGPFAVDGGQFKLEVYAPYLTIGSTNLSLEVYEGSTFISTLSGLMAASVARPGVTLTTVLTLSQGNHTLKVTAFVDAGTGKFGADTGATTKAPNAWALVTPL